MNKLSILLRIWGIILFSLFSLVFSSCKKPSQTSLEQAVSDVEKLLAAGSYKEIIDDFIIHENLGEYETIVQTLHHHSSSKPPFDFKLESSQVSGDMGIVILSIANTPGRYPLFAQWQNGRWKFHLDFIAWTHEEAAKNLGLSSQNEKDALILQKWAMAQPEVGSSGINALERLAWYVPFVPKDLKIEKFFETPSPSMDHEYMWKIKIEKTDSFKKFEDQLTQSPPNEDGKNVLSEVPVFNSHPQWWQDVDFNKGKLNQYRVKTVNGDERAYIFALFDRKAGYLYLQAF